MNINLKISFDDTLIKPYFTHLETTMSIILDKIKEELTAIHDEARAIDASFDLLIGEVRKLIALNDITGADALLEEAQELKHELQAAVKANTDLAAEIDAVNG